MLLLCFQLLGFSQNWEKWFGRENFDVTSINVFEHYDRGYLLTGKIGAGIGYIIKTSINGDSLWSKLLMGNSYSAPLIHGSSPTADGGFLICGSLYSSETTPPTYPFAAKFNACGEKEWCTAFYIDELLPSGDAIVENSYGDIGFVVYSSSQTETTYLYKLNANGEVLWKTNVCSRENYPDSRLPMSNSIVTDSYDNFIISGDVYWKNPWDDLYPIRPLIAQVTNDGIEQWVLPFGVEDDIHGDAIDIKEINNNLWLGVGSYWNDEYKKALFMQFDTFGNQLSYLVLEPNEISPTYNRSVLTSYQRIDDYFYLKSYSGPELQGNPVVEFKIESSILDNEFNLINIIQYSSDIMSPVSKLQKTYNNSLLSASTDRSGEDRIYLTKLNQDLEQDSIYTTDYTYDSLCNHPIESDIIYFNDCRIITAIDTPTPDEYQASKQNIPLKIYPNPANEQLIIAIENTEDKSALQLQIVDIMGVPQYIATIARGQQELILNIQQWPSGLYLVQIINNNKQIGVGRFLKI